MNNYINNYINLTRDIINVLNNIHDRNTTVLNNNLTNIRRQENNINLQNAVNSIINLAELRVIRQQNNNSQNITENTAENITENTNENISENTVENQNNENNTVLNNITDRILLNRMSGEENNNNYGFRVNNSFRLRRELNAPRYNIPPLEPPTQPPPPPIRQNTPPTEERQILFPPLPLEPSTNTILEPPPGLFSNRRISQLSADQIIELIRRRRRNYAQQQEDVIVRPTIRQIRNATILHIYKDISNITQQTTCPISLTPFEDNDAVIEIIYCKHIFKEINIRRHFRTSTRCPLCRFDIRDHEIAMRTQQNSESKNNSESKTSESKMSVK